MTSTLMPKSMCALAILVLLGSPGPAAAKDKAAKPASDVTGAINAVAPALAKPADAPVVIRAREAQERFAGARAAMEHALLLRESAPKSDIAAIETNMKGLLDDLTAVEGAGFAESANEARRLAREWHRAGMQILAPPAAGLTEMPLPMLIASKAEAVNTALDWLATETAANTPPADARASASPAAAAPMPVVAPKAAATMAPRHARHRAVAPAAPKAMAQNEASGHLLHDAWPLLFPPAILFMRKDEPVKR